jgi:trans-aconitate methyltransferase
MTERAEQRWESERYQKHTGFVPVLGAPVLELLAPKPGERILDLGCGDGALTEKLRDAGAIVEGIDASEAMIEAAKKRGLKVRVLDAQKLDVEQVYDAVFSNAALHWMLDPDAVIAGVRRALKPGGRFVGEFGGHGNVAAITVALVAALEKHGIDAIRANPWYFPTTDAYQERLEAHGFDVTSIQLIPRPTPLPTDMTGWLETMAVAFFDSVQPDKRDKALADTIRLLELCLKDEQGRWTADYVRLRFSARHAA